MNVKVNMATDPQRNLRRPRFGPSDSLLAMFRLAPQACSTVAFFVCMGPQNDKRHMLRLFDKTAGILLTRMCDF